MIALTQSAFERWAADNGYDIAPDTLPVENRVYADHDTQAAFDARNAGAGHVARMLTESTLETEAPREKIRQMAGSV